VTRVTKKAKAEGVAARLELALEARNQAFAGLSPSRPNSTGIRPAAPDAWGRGEHEILAFIE
jgi:hypothetical protein